MRLSGLQRSMINHRLPNRRTRRGGALGAGFTLIELLLVLVIIAILAGIVLPRLVGRREQAQKTAALDQIANFKTALNNFEIDNGRFPTSDEGLQALLTKPSDLADWKGPYLDVSKLPQDPWNHPYIYRFPGTNGKDYDLISEGADGQEGTADDITN